MDYGGVDVVFFFWRSRLLAEAAVVCARDKFNGAHGLATKTTDDAHSDTQSMYSGQFAHKRRETKFDSRSRLISCAHPGCADCYPLVHYCCFSPRSCFSVALCQSQGPTQAGEGRDSSQCAKGLQDCPVLPKMRLTGLHWMHAGLGLGRAGSRQKRSPALISTVL